MDAAGVVAPVESVTTLQFHDDPRERLRRVFHAASDALYRFILVRVGGDGHAADDVIQQTCYEAARHRRMPDDDEQCQAWMFGIARNLVKKHWREVGKRDTEVPLHNAESSAALAVAMESETLPAQAWASSENVTQLMLAITALPPADQELIFAFYFDGRSQAQIAGEENVSPKSVEARLYRIRTRLRTSLRAEERKDLS